MTAAPTRDVGGWRGTPHAALFLRGDSPSHLGKLDVVDGDALVLDLEDAVAPERKTEARELVQAALADRLPGRRLWVRVNAAEEGVLAADLHAAVWPAVEAVLLPKSESPADLAQLDAALRELERQRGREPGSVALVALVETARGLARLAQLTAGAPSRRVLLAFGTVDFTADLGVENTPGSPAVEHARAQLVLHSRAAGWGAPLDGPWLGLADEAGLTEDSRRSVAHGFGGRIAIHPGQVSAVRATYGFRGSADDRARAQRIVQAWESRDAGVGSLRVDDVFVDVPVYRGALRTLGRATD
ncbi:CoA ester lyase [uncultured Modestobacter sp.]|uniref:HpcH/HpaI aldolase/citrate lyase family protein n=1 Tax=uncultured Modestobacter sp. TaxID=380048 RepID=UPI0026206CED|nr:CoA ester lyase [uncultured Modestobacter sp.]